MKYILLPVGLLLFATGAFFLVTALRHGLSLSRFAFQLGLIDGVGFSIAGILSIFAVVTPERIGRLLFVSAFAIIILAATVRFIAAKIAIRSEDRTSSSER